MKHKLLLLFIIVLLISGCYPSYIRTMENPAKFICFNCITECECDNDYFEDTLIIKSECRQTSQGCYHIEDSTFYFYYGKNNPYIYEKCRLVNNGYEFIPSRIHWQR